jgi:2-iminobutanoate/2-iminopropanoate deaminase
MSDRNLITVAGIANPQWYSAAVRYGELIWTAGQVPVRADGSTPPDIADQVAAALDYLERVLQQAGAGFDTLLKVNAYLASMDDFDAYNAVYSSRIKPSGLPPKTTIEIARLLPPLRVEIEAVAHARPGA